MPSFRFIHAPDFSAPIRSAESFFDVPQTPAIKPAGFERGQLGRLPGVSDSKNAWLDKHALGAPQSHNRSSLEAPPNWKESAQHTEAAASAELSAEPNVKEQLAALLHLDEHGSLLERSALGLATMAVGAPWVPNYKAGLAVAATVVLSAALIEKFVKGDLKFHITPQGPTGEVLPIGHPNGPTVLTGAERIDPPKLGGKPDGGDLHQAPAPGKMAHEPSIDHSGGYQGHVTRPDEQVYLNEVFFKHQELMGLSIGGKVVADAYKHVDPDSPVSINQTELGDTIATASMRGEKGGYQMVSIKVTTNGVALVESDFNKMPAKEDIEVELELFRLALSKLHASQVPIASVKLLLPALEFSGSGLSPSARQLMPIIETVGFDKRLSLPTGTDQGKLARDVLALPIAKDLSTANMQLSATETNPDYLVVKFDLPDEKSRQRFNELIGSVNSASPNGENLN